MSSPEPADTGGTPAVADESSPQLDGQILVDDPAELIRIASMLTRLNTQLREIDLDQHAVDRIEALHQDVITDLEDNLHRDLIGELHRFVPALLAENRSAANVRVAHLLLVGWLEGLFQGIQMTAVGNQIREYLLQRRDEELEEERRSRPLPGSYL